MFDWLFAVDEKSVAVMNFIASTALTFAGIVVGVVTIMIGHWASNGWRPVVLVRGGIVVEPEAGGFFITGVQFEVWNRRKYPMALRKLKVAYDKFQMHQVTVLPEADEEQHKWMLLGEKTCALKWCDDVIEPGGHASFVAGFTVTADMDYDAALKERAVVTALLYDPHRNRHEIVSQTALSKAEMPDLE